MTELKILQETIVWSPRLLVTSMGVLGLHLDVSFRDFTGFTQFTPALYFFFTYARALLEIRLVAVVMTKSGVTGNWPLSVIVSCVNTFLSPYLQSGSSLYLYKASCVSESPCCLHCETFMRHKTAVLQLVCTRLSYITQSQVLGLQVLQLSHLQRNFF